MKLSLSQPPRPVASTLPPGSRDTLPAPPPDGCGYEVELRLSGHLHPVRVEHRDDGLWHWSLRSGFGRTYGSARTEHQALYAARDFLQCEESYERRGCSCCDSDDDIDSLVHLLEESLAAAAE